MRLRAWNLLKASRAYVTVARPCWSAFLIVDEGVYGGFRPHQVHVEQNALTTRITDKPIVNECHLEVPLHVGHAYTPPLVSFFALDSSTHTSTMSKSFDARTA